MKYKSTSTLMAAAALLTGLTGSVQAIPTSIEGIISFSGSATTDTDDLSTATRFTQFLGVTVGSAASNMGDYDGTQGAIVTMTPFTWDPVGASIPITPLWTFVSGANTYSFDLASMSVDFVSPTVLVLSGMGTASITGPGLEKLDTIGNWNLTGQTLGAANFTFSSSNEVPANVPDGGATATLLGVGMLGLGLLKRKPAARPSA